MTSMTDPDRVVYAGADTHRDTIHLAVVDELGRPIADAEYPTTTRGYQAAIVFLHAHGTIHTVAVEGTSSYGAGFADALRDAGIHVMEADRPDKVTRHRHGKSDPIDAYAAARAAAAGRATTVPKTRTGAAEAIRVLRVARTSAVKARTQAMNQLKNLLITAPALLRESITGGTPLQLMRACAQLPPGPDLADPATATKTALGVLSRRWLALTDEITTLDNQLAALVQASAPHLLAIHGVGTDTAGQLLVTAGDNPHRLHSEAAFAHLCGVAPVPASSGQKTRHRLNRGGDRQANRALRQIVITRLATDPKTRAYRDRRTKEGRTSKEIIRCLKRYVAREIHHALTA